MSIKKYIKNKKQNNFNIKGVEIFIKDEPPTNINVKSVINRLLKMVPSKLLRNLDVIYVGQFQHLKDREIQAVYENSSIFVTNEHIDEEDMLDDLVHEVAHSVEELYQRFIYGDKKIENEFLSKRKQLWYLLKSEGFDCELSDFLNVKFDKAFDEFLYRKVGYPALSITSVNLFYSPYGSTSIREYFANGFEAFFMKEDLPRLKNISPQLFTKILDLFQREEDENF